MAMIPQDALEAGEERLEPEFLQAVKFARGRRIAGIVSGFLLGQGAAQGVNVLAGLFLVRHLSLVSFAQFGLATGFQTVFGTLMDMGLAGTIVPMVGDRRADRQLVGRYVRSARHLRNWTFWLLAPLVAVSFLLIVHRQHWSPAVQWMLLISMLLSLYSGGKASYASAPLFLHGELRAYYVPQVVTGVVRLVTYAALSLVGGLNASVAALLGAFNVTLNAEWLQRKSRGLFDWPERSDRATERELIRYVLPAAPAMIFGAFQAQLTLLLISIFGGNVTYIAQVAALGRISQLFAVLMTFNLVIIEPYIARMDPRRLPRNFAGLCGLATMASVPVVAAAFVWPGAFLLLIGPRYQDLRGLLGWVVLVACINYVAGLIWIMNRARKWVFWSGSILEVSLLLGVQCAYVAIVGIRNTREAVFLSLAASICPLIAHVYVALYGLWRTRRDTVPAASGTVQ